MAYQKSDYENYILVKTNLVKEQNKFVTKFGLLDKEKVSYKFILFFYQIGFN